MVLRRRFQMVEAHGDVRYSRTAVGSNRWKKGYLKISWDSAESAWLCELYFEAKDRFPVVEERLIQKKLAGLPKSPEKAEEAGLIHFVLSNDVNIWIRRNINTYNRSLYAVAQLLKQIKEGQYEVHSPASPLSQYDSRPQSCSTNRYDNRWNDSPQKSFYGQQKCISRSSPSRSADLYSSQNRNYERVGTPKTYSRNNNWSNGYKNNKCYSEGDSRYTYSHRRRLAFSPSFSDKHSNVNSFSTNNANYRKQSKETYDQRRMTNNCVYTKENSWRPIGSSDNSLLSHKIVGEEKLKTSNSQTKDSSLEAISRSPLKSISSNGPNAETSKRPPLLDFPIPSKRLKLSSSDRNKDGECGEALLDPICEKSASYLRGFENLGNSCYMNSVLQALSYLDPFTNDLLAANDLLGEKLHERSLIRSLSSLLLAKPRGDDSQIQNLLEEIKEAVCRVASNFKGNYQHDAHEFLGQVLDQIKEEIAAGKECDVSNPIEENFEFDSLKSYLCQGCCQVIAKRETSNMLSLDIPKLRESDAYGNLQDALDIYFLPQNLEFRCEKCHSKDSRCVETFATLPRILIIHLKRYSFLQHSVKVAQPVSIPTYLTLQEHINESTSPCYPVPSRNESRVDYSWQESGGHPNTSVHSKHNESIESTSSHEENTSHNNRNTPESNVDSRGANILVDDKVEVICTRRKPRAVIQPSLKYGGVVRMTTPRLAAVGLCGGREDEGSVPSVGEENKENHLPNGHSYNYGKTSSVDGDAEPDHEVKDMQTAVEQSLQEAENQEEMELQKALQNSIEDASEWTTEEFAEKNEEEFWIYRSEEQRKAIEENFEKGNLQYSYQLKSIVSHIGHTAQSGHYLCDIYDPTTDSWWHFNDDIVQKTTKHEILHQRETSGYLFFYVAKEILYDNSIERKDASS